MFDKKFFLMEWLKWEFILVMFQTKLYKICMYMHWREDFLFRLYNTGTYVLTAVVIWNFEQKEN